MFFDKNTSNNGEVFMEMTKTRDNLEMIKLGAVLCLYAVMACTILALVNYFTLPIITKNKALEASAAMKKVFATADSFEKIEIEGSDAISDAGVEVRDVYLAKSGDEMIGAVCTAEGATYDRAKLIVGVTTEGLISGVEFLELTDSPGFGQKARDPAFHVASGKTFTEQFIGMSTEETFIASGSAQPSERENAVSQKASKAPSRYFDAISGATITSNGVANILNVAVRVLNSIIITNRTQPSAEELTAEELNEEALNTDTQAPIDFYTDDEVSANGDRTEYTESAGM